MSNFAEARLHPHDRKVARTRAANTQARTSKRITVRQAINLMEAVSFAREIETPLNAHATIHWVGTNVGDDPDGRRFAKVREGFDKWLKRNGHPEGLTAIWVRERLSGGSAEVVHCHMLFHLARSFTRGRKLSQVEWALSRLIDRNGDGDYADYTLKLTFPSNPNGLYLLKGGGPEVWRRFAVPYCWRKSQGLIQGKRCGTTENIGPTARKRWGTASERETTGARAARLVAGCLMTGVPFVTGAPLKSGPMPHAKICR